jgi:hypothetical protein
VNKVIVKPIRQSRFGWLPEKNVTISITDNITVIES